MSPVQNLELNVRFFPFRREVKRIRMMSKRRWQRSRPNLYLGQRLEAHGQALGNRSTIFHVNLARAILNYEQVKNRNLLRPNLPVVLHRKAADAGGIEALW